MAIEVIWFIGREEEFIDRACLNDVQAEIIRLRHFRYGRVKDCMILNERNFFISLETYDNYINELKSLYDSVQPGSRTLPPRQKNKKDALRVSKLYPIDYKKTA